MSKRALVIPILFAFTLSSCGPAAHAYHGSPYADPPQAPDFTLPEAEGSQFELSEARGHPVLLYFGYTQCPDVCPATLHNMAWVFDHLGDAAGSVRFLFVTTDPARDTPEVLRAYLGAFDPRFVGLYGDIPTLEQTARAYGVFFTQEGGTGSDDSGYLVSHTARVFLIDPQGLLQTNYSLDSPREDILADLQYLLQESGS